MQFNKCLTMSKYQTLITRFEIIQNIITRSIAAKIYELPCNYLINPRPVKLMRININDTNDLIINYGIGI